jgi:protein-L-isoaspartate(D-aspartate) O-methyltransferase
MRIMALLTLMALLGIGGCTGPPGGGAPRGGGQAGNGSGGGMPEDIQRTRRLKMVETQIRARGVADERVLEVMRKVPRHMFVPEGSSEYAYEDGPLTIGEGQTISQPYIVALMTELARPRPGDRVLEIGTGSGYQAAVLAELVADVYTIEIVEPLGLRAASLLKDLGYTNVHTRIGDGFRGWPEAAPFDAVIVTAAPGRIPAPLEEQLAVGGRLVIPVGTWGQELVLVTRTAEGFRTEKIIPVRFVPMTGEAERDR